MPAPDVSDLLRPSDALILWNDLSGKWQDPGNDFFCHEKRDGSGKWTVMARYGFGDGRDHLDFDDETQATAFFVNFLHARKLKAIEETHVAIPALN